MILVTGAGGFVGNKIMNLCKDTVASPSLRGLSEDDIRRMVAESGVDTIIHTAAISDIGQCQADPEGSYLANVLIPVYLAKAAKDIKLICFSSDQVYSAMDTEGPYTEDTVKPGNLYAEHKLEMERRVLEANPNAVLLRATWMYDMPLYGVANRGNFLMNLISAAMRGESPAFSDRSFRGITYVREVAEKTIGALRLPGGVYNFGSETDMTMYDTALYAADALGLKVDVRRSSDQRNLWMDCSRLRAQGLGFRSTAEGISACISDYHLK